MNKGRLVLRVWACAEHGEVLASANAEAYCHYPAPDTESGRTCGHVERVSPSLPDTDPDPADPTDASTVATVSGQPAAAVERLGDDRWQGVVGLADERVRGPVVPTYAAAARWAAAYVARSLDIPPGTSPMTVLSHNYRRVGGVWRSSGYDGYD